MADTGWGSLCTLPSAPYGPPMIVTFSAFNSMPVQWVLFIPHCVCVDCCMRPNRELQRNTLWYWTASLTPSQFLRFHWQTLLGVTAWCVVTFTVAASAFHHAYATPCTAQHHWLSEQRGQERWLLAGLCCVWCFMRSAPISWTWVRSLITQCVVKVSSCQGVRLPRCWLWHCVSKVLHFHGIHCIAPGCISVALHWFSALISQSAGLCVWNMSSSSANWSVQSAPPSSD